MSVILSTGGKGVGIPGAMSGGVDPRCHVQGVEASLQLTFGGDHWRTVQTCSLVIPPPPRTDTETHTVGKRSVRILLECFLILLVVSEIHCTGNPFLRSLSPVFCPV